MSNISWQHFQIKEAISFSKYFLKHPILSYVHLILTSSFQEHIIQLERKNVHPQDSSQCKAACEWLAMQSNESSAHEMEEAAGDGAAEVRGLGEETWKWLWEGKDLGSMLKVWVRESECVSMCELWACECECEVLQVHSLLAGMSKVCLEAGRNTGCWLKLCWVGQGDTEWRILVTLVIQAELFILLYSSLLFSNSMSQLLRWPEAFISLWEPEGTNCTSSTFWHSGYVPCTVNVASDRHTSKCLMGNIGSSGRGVLLWFGHLQHWNNTIRSFEMPLPSPAPQPQLSMLAGNRTGIPWGKSPSGRGLKMQ